MARDAARRNDNYYPTPDRITQMIASYCTVPSTNPDEKIVYLDPCAGEGLAIYHFMRLLGGNTVVHMVERYEERAEVCKEKVRTTTDADGNAIDIDEVMQVTAEEVKYPRLSYSAVWFNPPYDYDRASILTEDGTTRLSEPIFAKLFDYRKVKIMPAGGLFIGILPARDIKVLADQIWRMYEGPDSSYPLIFRFPQPDFEQFKQYVILGKQRSRIIGRLPEGVIADVMQGIAEHTHPALAYADYPVFTLPTIAASQIGHLQSTVYDPTWGAHILKQRGWNTRPGFIEHFWPPEEERVQPFAELSNAHAALLFTAGLLQPGALFDCEPEGGQRYLIRGRVIRDYQTVSETTPEVNDDGDSVVTRVVQEGFKTEVVLITEDGEVTILEPPTQLEENDKIVETGGVISATVKPDTGLMA